MTAEERSAFAEKCKGIGNRGFQVAQLPTPLGRCRGYHRYHHHRLQDVNRVTLDSLWIWRFRDDLGKLSWQMAAMVIYIYIYRYIGTGKS